MFGIKNKIYITYVLKVMYWFFTGSIQLIN
jgi:hypothetical protein